MHKRLEVKEYLVKTNLLGALRTVVICGEGAHGLDDYIYTYMCVYICVCIYIYIVYIYIYLYRCYSGEDQ